MNKPSSLTKTQQRAAAALSLPQVEALINDAANLDTLAAERQSAIDSRLADLQAEFDTARARVQPVLSVLANGRDEFLAQREAKLAVVHAWALANKQTLFSDRKKSLGFLRGTVGFRCLPPSVETEQGWTFKSAVAALLWGRAFLRRPEPTLDKQELLRQRERLLKSGPEKLAAVGLRIAQPEEFYFEPKTEAPESLRAAA